MSLAAEFCTIVLKFLMEYLLSVLIACQQQSNLYKMHKLANCLVASGERLPTGTYASDFSVCNLKCFDDMLFRLKITVEDEANIADVSRKFSLSVAERNCPWEL